MSGKAKLQAGTHGPAVIEGPATALSWLTVLPVRGSAQAFDRITGARVIANLPVVG
ncbi:MAG: adenosylcobinamide-GDP ribazoletransferase, partial [Corynebacterium matruchotii]